MISKLIITKVANYNSLVVADCIKYFAKFPGCEGSFTEELDELRWRNKFVGSFKNHISLNAVPLAEKIYEQLNIITFPFIERVACKGWSTAEGTWAWSMETFTTDGNKVRTVGSADSPRFLLGKKIKLDICDSGEIVGGK